MIEKWRKTYEVIIPSILATAYLIYEIYALKHCSKILLQDSEHYEKMMETIVTFMSIILSVFGFLIPAFLSGKKESKSIEYFTVHSDMNLFSKKLKRIVSTGLIGIFMSCILLLVDIMPSIIVNSITVIWLWILFYFMCSSYRFISIFISLLLMKNNDEIRKVKNKVSDEDIEKLRHIEKI